ncbi:MAG: amidophosphoribosyltransferase [Coriobacteriales bacterium]|jgi:amidophosphoribosyltransferase|nr:amidophosphoribosyltransferase [Coriobacteriales bacterium]
MNAREHPEPLNPHNAYSAGAYLGATHSDDTYSDNERPNQVNPGDERPDHPEEACAVFGIYAPGEDVSRLTYFGLHALQHRGQESAGIAVGDGSSVLANKDMGLVSQVFDESALATLTGDVAIGHTRYSTSGGFASWDAAQPHLSTIGDSIIALAHNGTLVNTAALRAHLVELGISFRSSADSEVAAKLIGYFTQKTHHMREGIRKTMEYVEGAYAMVLITQDALYAFRDPHGIRPLCLGRLPNDRGWVVSSETCGLDIVGADYYREVQPGEVVRLSGTGDEGIVIEQAVPKRRRALCIFEYVYFARPDSTIDGLSVYKARDAMGRALAQEAPVAADIVIGVPDSGVPSAIGYAGQSGIPYVEGIVKNRYVGRTFIQPTQTLRQRGIRLKLNPLPDTIANKRLIVVDDSIVRGNTSKQLVTMLREAGAREVHMRVVSPPVVWPCFYGIDTDVQDELIASKMSPAQIAAHIGADSLAFISHQGLLDCVRGETPGYCTACFSGSYPIMVPEHIQQSNFCDSLQPEWWPQESLGMNPLF